MKKHQNNIALIQIIAALMIVNHHSSELDIPFLRYFTKGGFLFNTIFVFISGYLLAKSYYNDKNVNYRKFLSKRIIRIYPALHISILLIVIIYLIIGKEFDSYSLLLTLSGFQYFFNIDTFGVQLWFVSVILICYLLFLPTFKLLREGSFLYLLFIVFFFIFVAIWRGDLFINFYQKVSDDIFYRLLYHYIIFSIGIMTLIKINSIEIINLKKAIILSAVSFPAYLISLLYPKIGIITLLMAVLLALSTMTILSFSFNKIANKIPIIFALSAITYEIYLIHVVVINFMIIILPGSFISYIFTFIISITLAFLISELSMYYIKILDRISIK
jgi:peptidoglycan/LPS O-acetylase OafA/YrhL